MCFTIDWKKEPFMKFVHQNPLIFQAKLLFFWVPDDIIVMDPFAMDIGFHDVDTLSAGIKHAIVVEPSGEYIFSLEQAMADDPPPLLPSVASSVNCTDQPGCSMDLPSELPGSSSFSDSDDMEFDGGYTEITNVLSLKSPYETQCTDYEEMTRRFNYTSDVIQQEECSEKCLADQWKNTCDCYPKLYSMKHVLKGNLCEYLAHLKCNDYMKTMNWLPFCQNQCTRPCREVRYKSYSFQTGNLNDYIQYE
ncbi:hypothetical protein V5799_026003 [Amblyomma americanum]|uniref:Uncharacterized protein n=1 Tax=Amblyomma americanum TaxID=6943 RepID=A0AAQ4DJU1_AMBAM